MKQKLLKLTALAIVILMMFSLFAACAKKDPDNDDKPTGSDATDPTGENTGNEDIDYFAALPKEDYNKYEFRVMTLKEGGRWDSVDFECVEPYGEPINDAVYDRNMKVEDKYNVTLKAVPVKGADTLTRIRNSVSTQDGEFDMIMPRIGHSSTLAREGLLLNLNEVPNLDLSQPYWDQQAVNDLSIASKLYMVTGDLMTLHHEATNLMLFNKNLIKSEGLEDPYQLVRDNKWTFDKMYSMLDGVTKDINGDDKLDQNDQWAMMVEYQAATALYTAMGERLIVKDNDDMPQIAMNSGRTEIVIEKVVSLMTDKSLSIEAGAGALADFMDVGRMFASGRVLFRSTSLRPVRDLRDLEMQDDFGILPLPKFDENQDRYYHSIQATVNHSNSVCIPVTSDPVRTGMIMQALCAASTDTIRTAYYDINLLNKNVRDTDSWDMLDIIFASRCYDLGTLYSWGSIGSLIPNLVKDPTKQFTSQLEQIRMNVEIKMAETVDQFVSLEH